VASMSKLLMKLDMIVQVKYLYIKTKRSVTNFFLNAVPITIKYYEHSSDVGY
jgi:hypothetical protein